MYRQASQFVHPRSRALEQVRSLKEHGSESPTATFQWWSEPIHWALTVGLAGEALMLCGETLGNRITPRGILSPEGRAAWADLARIVSTLGTRWPGH
jgi:hypothetical protein